MKLISRRAYASMRGISEGAVRKAIAAGKIPVVDGQIDPGAADAAWAAWVPKPREPGPLISRRAYAARRGVTEAAVRKAIAAGKIPVVDGQIDPGAADVAWVRNRGTAEER